MLIDRNYLRECIYRNRKTGEKVLKVKTGIQLMDLSIDMDNSDLAVTVSTQFFWVDNRVIKLKKGVSKLNLDPNILNELWIPDFYIYDLQSFHTFKLFRDLQIGLRIEEKENQDSGSLKLVHFLREALKKCDTLSFVTSWLNVQKIGRF